MSPPFRGRACLLAALPIGMLAAPMAAAQTLAPPLDMQAQAMPAPQPRPQLGPQLGPLPVLSPTEFADEAALLGVRMGLALGPARVWTAPQTTTRALALGRAMLLRSGRRIERPQLLLVVDRAESVQRLWVVATMPDGGAWSALGAVRISSGRPGKPEHFKTPVGVFDNDAAILGYRAEGTFNENHIRGIGVAGMRVWDFGWQTTQDWRKPDAPAVVRLEMHATDPTFLEGRLGRPDSEACIRIPAAFNQFMDQAGLIDARLLALAPQDRAIAALLPKDRVPTRLAGELVIVVDSSEPAAAISNPVEANAINQRFADWMAAQAAHQGEMTQPGGAAPPGRSPIQETSELPARAAAPAQATTQPSAYAVPITGTGTAASGR